jgi:glyoxylase-like metal-dependent hydrolase (beta-lactamase superfamily II)
VEANGWKVALLQVGILPMEPGDLAPAGVLSGLVLTPSNAVLLRGHGRTILVDAGSGPFVTLWPGATDSLTARLDAESASPDLVILTHLDFDHCGGLVARSPAGSLRPGFPGVPVLAPGEALAQARGDPADENAAQVVEALDADGLLDGYDDGTQPAPGLRMRAAPGHRLGHSILDIGDSLVHVADIVHHSVHVEHPEWDCTWDSEPGVALATRRAILVEVAECGSTVLTSHLPSPGRVERVADGLRWVELP